MQVAGVAARVMEDLKRELKDSLGSSLTGHVANGEDLKRELKE